MSNYKEQLQQNNKELTELIDMVNNMSLHLQDLIITENGTYTAEEGYDAIGTATVTVGNVATTLDIQNNSGYSANIYYTNTTGEYISHTIPTEESLVVNDISSGLVVLKWISTNNNTITFSGTKAMDIDADEPSTVYSVLVVTEPSTLTINNSSPDKPK